MTELRHLATEDDLRVLPPVERIEVPDAVEDVVGPAIDEAIPPNRLPRTLTGIFRVRTEAVVTAVVAGEDLVNVENAEEDVQMTVATSWLVVVQERRRRSLMPRWKITGQEEMLSQLRHSLLQRRPLHSRRTLLLLEMRLI